MAKISHVPQPATSVLQSVPVSSLYGTWNSALEVEPENKSCRNRWRGVVGGKALILRKCFCGKE